MRLQWLQNRRSRRMTSALARGAILACFVIQQFWVPLHLARYEHAPAGDSTDPHQHEEPHQHAHPATEHAHDAEEARAPSEAPEHPTHPASDHLDDPVDLAEPPGGVGPELSMLAEPSGWARPSGHTSVRRATWARLLRPRPPPGLRRAAPRGPPIFV